MLDDFKTSRKTASAYTAQERTELDPLNPYIPFRSGVYERSIEVGTRCRRMLTYIPADAQPSSAGILLLPPSGVTAEEFLAQSNWLDLADGEETKEKLILFVLESEADGWHTEEAYAAADGDAAYVAAAFAAATDKRYVCVHESKYYLVGYCEGGAAAQMAAVTDPAAFAGLVTIDAPSLPLAYLDQAGQDYAENLMGYLDSEHIMGIRKGNIPLPVWIISRGWADESPESRYWRRANGCGEKWTLRDRETHVYLRAEETPHPQNQDRTACRVWVSNLEDASAELGRKLNRRVWKDFLYGVRRWMADPGGCLRLTKDPIRNLGMEYRYETIDGFRREWFVYVPEVVRNAPGRPVPLVFALHGYTCTGEIYMGNSGWYDVADRYGFLVVFPTAIPGRVAGSGLAEDRKKRTASGSPFAADAIKLDNVPLPMWNLGRAEKERPDDLRFFERLMEDTCARYAVDCSRIYATGHSNGSTMTSWLGIAHPEWFAAIAPCSGILHMGGAERCLETPEAASRRPVDLPVWMFGGEMEPWLLDGRPAQGNRTGATIHAWWDLTHMPGEKPVAFGGETVHAERWNDWVFEKSGVPLLRFTGIAGFPHATMPEMSFRIWEEFFSKFRRAENGRLIYTP